MAKLKLTIISENRVDNPLLIAEQGLSIYIETDKHNILFDTGQESAICHNSAHLGLDLKNVDYIVLSHGHYDHGDGLLQYMKKYNDANVIAHSSVFNKKYSIINEDKKYIGLAYTQKEMEEMGAHFIFKSQPYEIVPNVIFSGEITLITEYEKIEDKYVERILESDIHDELHDEAALYIKTDKGLVILMGCGHKGPINTIKHGMRKTNVHKVHAILGGMHLKNSPDEKIDKIITALKEIKFDYIFPLHCTGFNAISKLRYEFGKKVGLLNVGDTFIV
ncbi:MAG: MBL fold metallo-hydrolase [Calditrichia bacterium]|nr:MBL fold metallo-hydrolase [Calditrichia bacterium]